MNRIVILNLNEEGARNSMALLEEARQVFPTLPNVQGFDAKLSTDGVQVLFQVTFENESKVEAYRVAPAHVQFVRDWIQPYTTSYSAKNYA